MTVVKAKGFLNLVSAPAVTLNYPFSLLFSAWRMLEPFRLECENTARACRQERANSLRIVIFYAGAPSVFRWHGVTPAGVQPAQDCR